METDQTSPRLSHKKGVMLICLNISAHFQVTGSNKGIGLAVVRGLCKKFNGDVLLTGELFHFC